MCRRLSMGLLIVLSAAGVASAQSKPPYSGGWIAGGALYGGLTGAPQLRGITGQTVTNRFEQAPGFYFEAGDIFNSGLAVTYFGTDVIRTENFVGSHAAKAIFYTPYYADLRVYIGRGSVVSPFVGGGFAWRLMHFDGSKGANNQFSFNGVAGARVRLARSGASIFVAAKPYRVFKNDLGQTRGWEVQLGAGRNW
jgi:hypothetical protein